MGDVSISPKLLSILTPGACLLIGELHGTKEMPRVTTAITRELLKMGREVSVFLELPEEMSVPFRELSEGRISGEEFLVASAFWRVDYDGRASESQFSEVCALAEIIRAGEKLEVIFFDCAEETNAARDRGQFENVSKRITGERVNLVHAGNVHAETKGVTAPPSRDYKTLGVWLAEAYEKTFSVVLAHNGGTVRYMTADDPPDLSEAPERTTTQFTIHTKREGELRELDDSEPWDFELNVGRISASRPANRML